MLTIFGSCLMSFLTIRKNTWRWVLAGSILGASVCQCFTFLVLIQVNSDERCQDEDVDCKFGFGGLCSLVACLLYFCAGVGVSILAVQPPKENPGTTFLVRLGNRILRRLGITWKQHQLQTLRWQDIVLIVYALFLLLISMTVLLDCRFYMVNYQNNTKEYYEGLYRYYYYPDDVCKQFEKGDRQSFSAQTSAGNAFGFISFLLAAILLVLLFSMTLVFEFPDAAYKLLPILAALTAITQSLVFLGNSERNEILCAPDIEDQSCELGQDGYLCIIGVILYIAFVPALVWYKNHPNKEENGALASPDVDAEHGTLEKEEEAPQTDMGTKDD